MDKKFRYEEIIQEYVDIDDSKIHSTLTREEKRIFWDFKSEKVPKNPTAIFHSE